MSGSLSHSETTQIFMVNSPHEHKMTFEFEYKKSGEIWRVYILNSPDYQSRPTDLHNTNRVMDEDGKYYVSWLPDLFKFEKAVEVSKLWAKGTANYIDTGNFTPNY